MAFHKEFTELKNELEQKWHTVVIPELKVEMTSWNISIREYLETKSQAWEDLTWLWEKKHDAMTGHFNAIQHSDCILVANYEKKSIPWYIGINTMLEMGLALYLNKPIYLLYPIPDQLDWMDEIYGMMPVVIDWYLSRIP
jgi:hypothetical protein